MVETTNETVETTNETSEEEVEFQTHESDEDNEVVAEADDGEEVVEESEDDEIEVEQVEFDGEVYDIPKSLKEHLTKSTESALESGKQNQVQQQQELATRQQQSAEVSKLKSEIFNQHAELYNIDNILKEYDNVDWDRWTQENPTDAQRGLIEQNRLMAEKNKLMEEIKNKNQSIGQQIQAERSQNAQQSNKILKEKIPGWGKQKHSELTNFAKQYGYSDQDMAQLYDARAYQIINDAYKYNQSLNKAKKAVKPQKNVAPVKKIRGKAKSTKDPDKMPIEDWVAHRRKEVAKKRGY